MITVTNTDDSGPGSLRQALADVQNGDTIVFKLGGAATISLMSGELVINKNIAVTGPGANLLTIARAQGAPSFRIFHVRPAQTVTIQGVTISNGAPFDFAIGGAGIWNDHANLTVNNCVLTGNAVDRQVSGGGISNDAGDAGRASLTINNSIISENNHGLGGTANFGGGIYNYGINGNATLTINNSTISSNESFQGGGLFNDGGVPGGNAVVTINNSTLSGNSAQQLAGAIVNEGNEGGQATVTVTNSTFADNSSFANAVFNDGNHEPGGAILEMGNTIFKGGLTTQRNIYNQGGVVISDGYNLTDDAGVLNTNGGVGGFNAPGDQINTDPLLGPLQDNGGSTLTHALLPGSPAIDAGDPNFTPPPFFDQRGPGFDRVVNGRIDKGSFEVQGPTSTPTATPSESCTVKEMNLCGSVVSTAPTDFIVQMSCPVNNVQPSGFLVNNMGANSFTVSNFVITFHFNSSPAVPGLNTIHILPDAVTCCIRPSNEFTCTFTYKASSTPTPTPTATSTLTPRPSPTARPALTPRPRPTPPPRP